MADSQRNSRSKHHRRSKSVTSERSSFDGESHQYELRHSVSYTEKAETVKKKNKKQLVDENIALDSAKLMVEEKLNDLNKAYQMLKQDNHHLKLQLHKSEKEKKQLQDETKALDSAKQMVEKKFNDLDKAYQLLKQDNNHLESQFHKSDRENRKLTEEGSILNVELETKKQEISKLRADFDAKRTILEKENMAMKENLKMSQQQFFKLRTEFDVEKRDMIEKQTKERKESWEFVRHFSKLLEENRAKVFVTGSSRNVQIGGTNIVNEEIKEQWKELTDKLCLALEDHMIKRKELEMKLRNDEVLFKEMAESITKILKKMDNATSKKLGQDKELLAFLTSDRSDEHVLTDGIKELKRYFARSTKRKNLPLAAEAAVTRLLNKFDGFTCKEFAEVLEGKRVKSDPPNVDETKKKEVFDEDMKSIQLGESDKEIAIDRRMCVEILSQWFNQSDENDEEQLLGRIKVYESKLSAEMVSAYQEEIKQRKTTVTGDSKEMQLLKEHSAGDFEIPYDNQGRTQSLQGLPDALSQFMHQLEGLKIVLEIDKKVDKICSKLNVRDTHSFNDDTSETSL